MGRRCDGYTLVEMAVTAATVALLAVVGIPSMAALVEHQRATAAMNSLSTHMALARLAAVSHRRPAILCPSSSGTACDAGSDWSGGWMLLLDSNNNRKPDPGDQLLRVELAPTSRSLTVHSTSGRPLLRYLPDGRSAGSNLTIAVCSPKGALLGSVIVNNAGRPRTSRPTAPTPCPA
jgi:type IV fimbrial biogenesis protein FimT